MPYKALDRQRDFQATWMWRRRQAWILENGPCHSCGSRLDLRVVRKDSKRSTIRVTSIWSLNDERREELLAECMVLCKPCALAKIREERPQPEHGTTNRYKQGCRCDPCKEAKAVTMAEYRAAKRKERAMKRR